MLPCSYLAARSVCIHQQATDCHHLLWSWKQPTYLVGSPDCILHSLAWSVVAGLLLHMLCLCICYLPAPTHAFICHESVHLLLCCAGTEIGPQVEPVLTPPSHITSRPLSQRRSAHHQSRGSLAASGCAVAVCIVLLMLPLMFAA